MAHVPCPPFCPYYPYFSLSLLLLSSLFLSSLLFISSLLFSLFLPSLFLSSFFLSSILLSSLLLSSFVIRIYIFLKLISSDSSISDIKFFLFSVRKNVLIFFIFNRIFIKLEIFLKDFSDFLSYNKIIELG